MPERDWNEIYQKAKGIQDVPWETGKPSPELGRLVREWGIQPCRALDIGCGFGTHAIFLAKKGFEVTALDISEKAIQVARERAKKEKAKVSFLVVDATTAHHLPGTFGLVFDRGLFHHLEEKQREPYIKKIHGLLDPGGKYYLEVFSKRNPPGPGPFRFTTRELDTLFSHFKILSIREIAHTENTNHSTVYLYSVLMEKMQ